MGFLLPIINHFLYYSQKEARENGNFSITNHIPQNFFEGFPVSGVDVTPKTANVSEIIRNFEEIVPTERISRKTKLYHS